MEGTAHYREARYTRWSSYQRDPLVRLFAMLLCYMVLVVGVVVILCLHGTLGTACLDCSSQNWSDC